MVVNDDLHGGGEFRGHLVHELEHAVHRGAVVAFRRGAVAPVDFRGIEGLGRSPRKSRPGHEFSPWMWPSYQALTGALRMACSALASVTRSSRTRRAEWCCRLRTPRSGHRHFFKSL